MSKFWQRHIEAPASAPVTEASESEAASERTAPNQAAPATPARRPRNSLGHRTTPSDIWKNPPPRAGRTASEYEASFYQPDDAAPAPLEPEPELVVKSEPDAGIEPQAELGDTETESRAEPEPASPKRRRKKGKWGRRVAWWSAMITMGALLGVAVIWVLKFVDGPAVGTATTSLAQLQATPTPGTGAAALLGGLEMELSYPGAFDEVSRAQAAGSAIEQYNISSKADYRRSIAVSVRQLPSSQLHEDASYRLREIKPDEYTIDTKQKLNGEPVAYATKTDHSELTLFWAHKGKVLSVAVMSTNPAVKVEDLMKQVAPTVRWRS